MSKELLINRESEEELDIIRHDCAHVLAEAVQSLFPGTQVTIGPTIENGFYYDFSREKPFTSDDLIVIEKKMHEIVDKGENFKREVWTQKEAIDYFSKKGETYKVELINDIPETEEITIYRQGDWLDLCRGPHSLSTKDIGEGFKLTKVAGAYWRGDSNKTMLTRIYGLMFANKKDLKKYLHQREEAKKRDHRKLGKELDLFSMHEEAGAGFVHWHPRGTTLRMLVEDKWKEMHRERGYDLVSTPHVVSEDIYRRTGHLQAYEEVMFAGMEEDGQAQIDVTEFSS